MIGMAQIWNGIPVLGTGSASAPGGFLSVDDVVTGNRVTRTQVRQQLIGNGRLLAPCLQYPSSRSQPLQVVCLRDWQASHWNLDRRFGLRRCVGCDLA